LKDDANSQRRLFGVACPRCPVGDCPERGDDVRACDCVELQEVGHCALNHLSPDLGHLLLELDDFSIPAELPAPYDGPLPSYIPQLIRRVEFPERLPPVVAVTLGEFVSKNGSFAGGLNAAQRLRVRGAKDIILVGTSLDRQLEAIWRQPDRFVSAVREAGIETVLGPAFSVYVGRPPIERTANRARSLEMYDMIARSGFNAIPAVGFVDAQDAAHAAGWITSRGLHTVFVDLQSAESTGSWEVVRSALPVLVVSGRLSRIVINGIAYPDRVRELVELVAPASLIVTNAGAAHTARLSLDYLRDVRGLLVKRRTAVSSERVFWNLAHYYHRVTSEPGERYVSLSVQPMMF
jgi:hypothetical protein